MTEMKILVTGATGYIGKRIIPLLLNEGHSVVCSVRDKQRVSKSLQQEKNVTIIESDFLNPKSLLNIPKDISIAYYLLHSMSHSSNEFHILEEKCASNFKSFIETTSVNQVIYLGGIVNDTILSKHLLSRKNVENILQSKIYALTTFKAGIIVGSGSSSFEIIRDLVEKLPIMIAPKWLNTRTQPIAIKDVSSFLLKAIGHEQLWDKSFDIYGPEILTYKEMLLEFAKIRGLKRKIITVPFMTPKLSSYWLNLVTTTSYELASTLVNSMGVEVIGKASNINKILNISPIPYNVAVKRAFIKIKQNGIISSWKDSFISGHLTSKVNDYINIPTYGCFTIKASREVLDMKNTLNKIWEIGGETGWYYGNLLWKLRGYIDKLFGGVGLNRGRTHPKEIYNGNALDFWRVIYANKDKRKLLLYSELKEPGEAWLEFKIQNNMLNLTATFRPNGISGRLYWYVVTPFHMIIFKGLILKLI